MGDEEEAPLQTKCEEEEEVASSSSSSSFWEEMKRVSFMAAPMVAVTASQYLVQVVSMMMVGHINGKLSFSFSSVAIATSFAEATGFGVLVKAVQINNKDFWNFFLLSMAGALETLCGQNYGAKEYSKLGDYTCCAIITLMLVCVPISVVWIFMDRILVVFGQDPQICEAAGIYCIYLIPALFGYAVLQSLARYFQTQSMMFPMVLCSNVVLCLHIALCWILVFRLGMRHVGAALAIGISYWINAIGLGLYVKYSSACHNTHIVFSTNALLCIGEFLHYAIPSGLMLCFEWWSFELLILLAGHLPNPHVETSVLSICLNTTTLHYLIPYAVGAVASTRVSNEIGVVLVLAIANALVFSTSLFFGRHILGYAYTNEQQVVHYVAQIVPLLCLSMSADSLVGILSGDYYRWWISAYGSICEPWCIFVVGIPMAALLGFSLHFTAKGLWLGMLIGSFVQVIILSVVLALMDIGRKRLVLGNSS